MLANEAIGPYICQPSTHCEAVLHKNQHLLHEDCAGDSY